jgi:hypothetical protein
MADIVFIMHSERYSDSCLNVEEKRQQAGGRRAEEREEATVLYCTFYIHAL